MSPWEELGISPTTDSGVIRKAYAGRLKQNKPEDDQEGFKRLRAAYEIALVLAARAVQHGHQAVVPAASTTSLFNPVGVKRREEASPPPISTPPTKDAGGNLDPESQAALQSILAAFSHQDGESAARLIESAIDRNLLPLAVELGLSERLVSVLLNDGSMPAKRLLEIAKRFGWYGVPDALRGRNGWMEHRLCSRIDAELWFSRTETTSQRFHLFSRWSHG